jgi:hypothetical protein
MMPNFIAEEWCSTFAIPTKEFPVRFPEIHSVRRATAENICKHLNRIPHHESLPAPESNLLDDLIEAQTRGWEHLWIDIGGEG